MYNTFHNICKEFGFYIKLPNDLPDDFETFKNMLDEEHVEEHMETTDCFRVYVDNVTSIMEEKEVTLNYGSEEAFGSWTELLEWFCAEYARIADSGFMETNIYSTPTPAPDDDMIGEVLDEMEIDDTVIDEMEMEMDVTVLGAMASMNLDEVRRQLLFGNEEEED
jgi:hypothetical protein